jgi:hypothetical protein
MSTITIPINKELQTFIDYQLQKNYDTKTNLVRDALNFFREELELRELLRLSQEVKEGKVMKGDIRKLVENFS